MQTHKGSHLLPLELRIKTGEVVKSIEVLPNESVVIGRSRSCQVVLTEQAVSQKHLGIFWDGTLLSIKDLGSSNGTFRLPQKAPFVEASWSGQDISGLSLLLSNTPVEIGWKIKGVDNTKTIEATAVLEGGAKTAAANQASVDDQPHDESEARAGLPIGAVLNKEVLAKTAPVRSTPSSGKKLSSQDDEVSVPNGITMCLGGLIAVACSYFFWKMYLGEILLAPLAQWNTGIAKDIFLGWWQHTGSFAGICFLLFLVVMGVVVFRKSKVGLRLRSPLKRVVHRVFWSLGCVLITLSFFGVPMMVALSGGAPVSTWGDLVWLYKLDKTKQSSIEILNEITKRQKSFEGSSFFYIKLFEWNQRRVLQECRGQIDASWDEKKVCLILLTATGIESLDKAAPVFFRDIAARAALILSLDGIIRVVTVEGLQAPSLPFFMASLEVVGLTREREDIENILKSADQDVETVLRSLRTLKSLLDKRMVSRQQELKTPRFLSFVVKSSVELGI